MDPKCYIGYPMALGTEAPWMTYKNMSTSMCRALALCPLPPWSAMPLSIENGSLPASN